MTYDPKITINSSPLREKKRERERERETERQGDREKERWSVALGSWEITQLICEEHVSMSRKTGERDVCTCSQRERYKER